MQNRLGFTLVEIAIVIVIIGLIVGGVMVGRDLIHASEVRGLMSEINQFQTSYTTFKLKYQCIPGDCKDASTFFGTANACDGSTITTGACNGDGDGKINSGYVGWYFEEFWSMQQLLAANLINFPISFPANFSAGGENANFANIAMQVPGVNAPASQKYPQIGFFISYLSPGDLCAAGYTWPDWAPSWAPYCTPGNYLSVGSTGMFGLMGAATGYPKIMPNPEVADMDVKMDDGMPNTGSVLCVGECSSGWIYLTTSTYSRNADKQVSLIYRLKD